jgi:hypothetical protein
MTGESSNEYEISSHRGNIHQQSFVFHYDTTSVSLNWKINRRNYYSGNRPMSYLLETINGQQKHTKNSFSGVKIKACFGWYNEP